MVDVVDSLISLYKAINSAQKLVPFTEITCLLLSMSYFIAVSYQIQTIERI